jgi:hypothetical protein
MLVLYASSCSFAYPAWGWLSDLFSSANSLFVLSSSLFMLFNSYMVAFISATRFAFSSADSSFAGGNSQLSIFFIPLRRNRRGFGLFDFTRAYTNTLLV